MCTKLYIKAVNVSTLMFSNLYRPYGTWTALKVFQPVNKLVNWWSSQSNKYLERLEHQRFPSGSSRGSFDIQCPGWDKPPPCHPFLSASLLCIIMGDKCRYDNMWVMSPPVCVVFLKVKTSAFSLSPSNKSEFVALGKHSWSIKHVVALPWKVWRTHIIKAVRLLKNEPMFKHMVKNVRRQSALCM